MPAWPRILEGLACKHDGGHLAGLGLWPFGLGAIEALGLGFEVSQRRRASCLKVHALSLLHPGPKTLNHEPVRPKPLTCKS